MTPEQVGPDVDPMDRLALEAAIAHLRGLPGPWVPWGFAAHPDTIASLSTPQTGWRPPWDEAAWAFWASPVWADETVPIGVLRPVRMSA